jgi:hypothetical protein
MTPRHNHQRVKIFTKNGSSILLTIALIGCGVEVGNPSSKKPKVGPTIVNATDVVGDSQLTSSIVNASHGDAVAASIDQGSSSTNLRLAAADTNDDTTSATKLCAVSSDSKSAIVTVNANISRTRTKTSAGGRVTVKATRTGSGTSTRTWSRIDSTSVACKDDKMGALVDLKNPAGLRLDVSFERNRIDDVTFTGPRLTRSSTRSVTSVGARTITWASNDDSGGSTTSYARNKSVVIRNTTHSLTMTDKNGNTVATNLTINTPDTSPLLVKVERSNATNKVLSKTFISGQIVVNKDSDATITTTYSNLKLNFSDDSCSVTDGSAQVVISDSAGTIIKSLKLSKNSEGDSALFDESVNEVEGFVLDPCDSEDSKT